MITAYAAFLICIGLAVAFLVLLRLVRGMID